MFTPAEGKGGQACAQLPATGRVLLPQSPSRLVLTPGSKESPIAWLVAIWPPVVLGTSRGKGVARGQGGPVLCPMGLPPRQTARCVYPLAWADGAGKDRGGRACQNCHCGQGDRARASQGAVVLPSPPPPKAQGPPAQLRPPKSWLVWGPDRWSWEWATKVAFGGPPGRN